MMKHWLQRARGAVGIGVTWAAAWAPIGAIAGWITGAVLGFPLAVIATNYAVLFGTLGFAGGTIFSTILGLADGRRRFDQLSLPRFVAWGSLGGVLLGGIAVAAGILGAAANVLGVVIIAASALLGAGSAAGTLAIARARHDRSLTG